MYNENYVVLNFCGNHFCETVIEYKRAAQDIGGPPVDNPLLHCYVSLRVMKNALWLHNVSLFFYPYYRLSFRKSNHLSLLQPFRTPFIHPTPATFNFKKVCGKKKEAKAVLLHATKSPGGEEYSSYSFLTSALYGGEWSASCPGHALVPGKEPPVPTGQDAVSVFSPTILTSSAYIFSIHEFKIFSKIIIEEQ
jgi:hypothetical protein